jgi:hypothetical protein
LNEIPESQLLGIDALPIELWSAIIEYVVARHLRDTCYHYPRTSEMRHDLGMRLVCRRWSLSQVFQFETDTYSASSTKKLSMRCTNTSRFLDYQNPCSYGHCIVLIMTALTILLYATLSLLQRYTIHACFHSQRQRCQRIQAFTSISPTASTTAP